MFYIFIIIYIKVKTFYSFHLVDLKGTESYSEHSDDSGVLLRTIHDEGYVKESQVSAYIKANSSFIINNQEVSNQLSLLMAYSTP